MLAHAHVLWATPMPAMCRWSYVGVAAQLATAQLMDSGPGGDGSVKAGKAKAGGGDAPAIGELMSFT